jgi:hypothetical protein
VLWVAGERDRDQFLSQDPEIRWRRTNEISSATALDERKQADHEIIKLALNMAARETSNRALLCFRFVRLNSDLDTSRDFMQPLGNLSDNHLVLRKDCDRRSTAVRCNVGLCFASAAHPS